MNKENSNSNKNKEYLIKELIYNRPGCDGYDYYVRDSMGVDL